LITSVLPLTFLLQHLSPPPRLLNLIDDFERFILRFFDIIKESAMHIYHSALPWSPTLSLIRELYGRQMMREVMLVNATDAHWNSCIRTIPFDGADPICVVFSPKGSALAVASYKGVKIFETATGVATFQIEESVWSVSFSPDDDMFVCGHWDGTIRVWDVQTSYLIRSFEGHKSGINSVAFSPLGDMIVSGSDDNTIRIWDMSSNCCKCVLEGHSEWVRAVCWSRTGDRVISGSYDCSVRVWDVSTQECLMILRGHTYSVISVACSCDSSLIASGSRDGTVQVYDAQSGDVLHTILANAMWIHSVQFSTHGDKLFYTNRYSATIWDLSKKEKVSTINHGEYCSTFSHDGTRVASIDGSFLKIWTTENGYSNSETVSHHHSKEIKNITFAPDGRLMTSRCDDYAKVWDTTSGDCLFTGSTCSLRSIAFSPNSAFLACLSTGDSYIEVWDVHTSCLVKVARLDLDIGVHEFEIVALSPCGGRLISLLGSQIILWDLGSGKRLAYLYCSKLWWMPPRITFAVDGTSVFIHSDDDDKIIHRWRISPAPLSNHQYDSNIAEFTSLPLVFIPMQDESSHHVASVPRKWCRYHRYNPEWILDENGRHLLWLPQDRRYSGRKTRSCHGKKTAIGTIDNRIYVADFSNVL
jgi:WD40 repeat protein